MFIQANLPWKRIRENEFVWVNERIRIINNIDHLRGCRVDIAYMDYHGYSQLRFYERDAIAERLHMINAKIKDAHNFVETNYGSKIRGYSYDTIIIDDYDENSD